MFDGIRLETTTNRRSIIRKAQYEAYKHEFDRKEIIGPPTRTQLRSIGGFEKVMREASIRIQFKKLGLIIDVDLAILDYKIQTFL